MANAPHYNINLQNFWNDPYPDLAHLREHLPVAFVPELGATLITRRNDIFELEKKIDFFSSVNAEGPMVRMMGQNMMRKDGDAHLRERKAIAPAVSPKTVKTIWKAQFEAFTQQTLNDIKTQGQADMANDIAKRLSGEALMVLTGLRSMTWQEMDRVSQGMIDAIANYVGDPIVEANCRDCTNSIENHIAQMMPALKANPDHSVLSVQMQAGMPEEQIIANVKLAISGGQNEPRDVIAGMVWALLTHPAQLQKIKEGQISWRQALDEYLRWMSPIGMSPRTMAKPYRLHDIVLEEKDTVFFMFGSANRDAAVFSNPDHFDVTQDCKASIAFGAGPHYCAGAWASRCLIAEVAMPAIFARLNNLRLNGETIMGGWAFRGPLQCPVAWDA